MASKTAGSGLNSEAAAKQTLSERLASWLQEHCTNCYRANRADSNPEDKQDLAASALQEEQIYDTPPKDDDDDPDDDYEEIPEIPQRMHKMSDNSSQQLNGEKTELKIL